jgi:hypothetical protein
MDVAINQEYLRTAACERGGQVGGYQRLAFLGSRTGDEQDAGAGSVREGETDAQRSECFSLR